MAMGLIKSKIYTSTSQFVLDTYSLNKNTQLTTFMALPNYGCWVLKNTSSDKSKGITQINDVAVFKYDLLDKAKRGLREQLHAIIGTGITQLDEFIDSDEEETKGPATASDFLGI